MWLIRLTVRPRKVSGLLTQKYHVQLRNSWVRLEVDLPLASAGVSCEVSIHMSCIFQMNSMGDMWNIGSHTVRLHSIYGGSLSYSPVISKYMLKSQIECRKESGIPSGGNVSTHFLRIIFTIIFDFFKILFPGLL